MYGLKGGGICEQQLICRFGYTNIFCGIRSFGDIYVDGCVCECDNLFYIKSDSFGQLAHAVSYLTSV